jgi:glycosyltransferase involved in cell wall biosynthesis
MNILFIITRADAIGGAQVHVKDLAVSLQEDHHKVLVLTGESGIYNEDLDQAGIESIACDSLKRTVNPVMDGKSLRYILYIVDQFKPDLIAAHSSKTGILARLASQITKVPCVFTAHGWSFTTGIPEPSRTIYRWLEKLTASLADKIGLQAGMSSDKLLTIHNGMKDVGVALKANQAQAAPIKVAMVARFDRQKDHQTLIEAFKDLKGELLLIGDGPGLEGVKARVEQLGMNDRVSFLGFRQDIAEILATVQIYALISNWEGLPCTIIEAMRAGLPVVASDVGGVREIVIDGQTGYLVPRGDIQTVRQKLDYLLSNEQARISMGILGRQKYESQLTFQHMYAKTLSTYQAAIAKRRQSLIAQLYPFESIGETTNPSLNTSHWRARTKICPRSFPYQLGSSCWSSH